MKSQRLGKNISKVEILNISSHGFWLYVGEKEYFLPFGEYPWFQDAKITEIQEVQFLHGQHLYWPKLDIDLELASLDYPEAYPLKALIKLEKNGVDS